MLCFHTVPSGVPNGGCAPNVSVGLVFFTLIMNLAVGTASNQLMNVRQRVVSITAEWGIEQTPEFGKL